MTQAQTQLPLPDLFDTELGPHIIGVEGAYTNNPSDSGGETIWGITVGVARENGYTGPMKLMTREQALKIYKAKYYIRAGIHLLAPISKAVALEVFDTGVNQGVGTAGTYLQRALNVANRGGADYADINVDGGVGQQTANALRAHVAKRGDKNLLKMLNALQGAFYIQLAESREKDEAFVNGWFENRVS